MNLAKVTCSQPGYRRCGHAWSESEVVDMDQFDKEQLERLSQETKLHFTSPSEEEREQYEKGLNPEAPAKKTAKKKASKKAATKKD
ncbi:MAG: hypothetical protein GKR93_11975 [Gammaproteobacteria bacterium]|nr:hypothetical protein [Gammaproteobacteria bacterium]